MPLGPRRVVRAAAVGGAVHHVNKKRSESAAEDAQAAQDQAVADAEARTRQEMESNQQAQQTATTAGQGDDLEAKLAKLAQLHESGALTDEEFAAAKAKELA